MDSQKENIHQNKKPRLGEVAKDGKFIQLTKDQIPEYLKSSEFFASLSSEDDVPFQVPSCCFKRNTTVTLEEDVRKLLSTVRFWGVKEIFPSLIEYCRKHCLPEEIVSEFENELPYVKVFPSFHLAPQKGVMRQALLSGQLNLVLNLLENGYCFSPYSVSHAIEGGNMECVEYVCHHAYTALMDRIEIHFQECAKFGRLECLKYIHTISEQDLTVECGVAAIRKNHVDCLKYIAGNLPSEEDACWWAPLAAELGHIECLRCIAEAPEVHFNGVNTCISAARSGHLDILRYLHEHGCSWDKHTIIQAMKYNQLPCLQYAIAQKCYKSGHDKLCTMAAKEGSLESLRYLCEHGHICDDSTMIAAVEGEHSDCIAYLTNRM